MKKLFWFAALLLASSCTVQAQSAAADFPVKVHVSSSELRQVEPMFSAQFLKVEIEGKKYLLVSHLRANSAFHVGNYQARMVKEKVENSAEFSRQYEFRFDDGKTQKFDVIGEVE